MRRLATLICGGTLGAGLASLASAATRGALSDTSFGPPIIVLFGQPVPVFSALFGLIGLLLARRVAPASAAGARLGPTGNAALTGLLALGVLALIIAGQKQPIVALAWAMGLGWSGLGICELVAKGVVSVAKLFVDAVVAAWTAKVGSNSNVE
jgi:hypothetical protein